MFPITKWNRYKPRFPLVVGGGEAEPSRFQAAVRLPSYPQGSQLISCAKILARHGGEDTRIGRNGHSILCTLFYTRNVPNKFADYFSFFFLFLLNLFFRAVSGLHKNEQKLQRFPIYLSAPQMCDLLHYQYPPTKWHICYSDEPTLKCQNHPEHIVYICLAYSMGFEKCLMKCNKLLHIENRFIAPQIPCAPLSHPLLVTTHLRTFTIVLFFPEYITVGITAFLI